MTRFKDPRMQRMFEVCREAASDTTSEFYHQGHPRSGAVHREAYWKGRGGRPSRWIRTSLAHAAWAAGREDMRRFGWIEYGRRPKQHDAHVRDRDRHLSWCADQWAMSNGIEFVTECGTIIRGED